MQNRKCRAFGFLLMFVLMAVVKAEYVETMNRNRLMKNLKTDYGVKGKGIGEYDKHLKPETNLLNVPAHDGSRIPSSADLSNSYNWILNNRVFMPDRYTMPLGGSPRSIMTKEAALNMFNAINWNGDTYFTTRRLRKTMHSYAQVLRSQGKDPAKDEAAMMLHKMLDEKFVNGRWGEGGTPNGNMKIGTVYRHYGWPIPDHKAMIDFTLDYIEADGRFKGRGCVAFNQMFSMSEARRQFPDGYRVDELDEAFAQSFLTFLENWREQVNFYDNSWIAIFNNGVPRYMANMLLDLPIMNGCAVYNWREGPIITRGKDGTITRNKVIYTKPGYSIMDG